MKCAWIHTHRSAFSVKKMCRVLDIARSTYYAWLSPEESKRKREDAQIEEAVRSIFEESRGTYGTPRILRELKPRWSIGKNRLDRLKRKIGIFARQIKKFRVQTTDSKHGLSASPNLLEQNFTADAPNRVWLSDITYIRLTTGVFAYVCVILDLFSREVIGWNAALHMRSDLVIQAMRQATFRREPGPGLIFHSDRGVQYASAEFRGELKRLGAWQSMSRRGNCYDNAPAESFFATLKLEEVYRNSYASLDELRRNLFDYIEAFYNRKRKHSALGYVAPSEFHSRSQAA